MPAQVPAEPSQVKFFASSDGNCVITRGNHGFRTLRRCLSDVVNFLPISEQRLALEMRVRIERTERETTTRTQKLGERGVARHPGQLQSVGVRQVQGSLHRSANRTSRSKDYGIADRGDAVYDGCNSPIDARTKVFPGFHTVDH